MSLGKTARVWISAGFLLCFAHLCLAESDNTGGLPGIVTGGIVDQFRRDDPNGNMVLLKDALEDEVRQRQLSTDAITPILNRLAPWITHLRDLKGDPTSLRISLGLEALNARDVETLARLLNLPPAAAAMEAPAPVLTPKPPVTRKLAHTLDRDAEQAFDAFSASLTPAPPAADGREWSASGAPRRR